MDWKDIDPNMAVSKLSEPENLRWYDPAESPFEVRGLYWFREEKKYQRFPERAFPSLAVKAPGASVLGRNPTGGQVAFETDARRIVIVAKLQSAHTMDHFAATGEMGIDCYIAYPGETYAFESVSRMDIHSDRYVCELVKDRGNEWKKVILNLPLYMTVESLIIGLPAEARIAPPEKPVSDDPVVFYGTSITQGGCASRPGLLYTNILSRKMNRPFLNFGFSGSGKGEPEVAELLAEIRNPALYVLTYEANAAYSIKNTLKPFIAVLRSRHPDTPVWVISRMHHQKTIHSPSLHAMWDELRQFQCETVASLRAEGDRNIRFIDGRSLLSDAPDECFVDGEHPNDLGFWQIANALYPLLKNELK